jgi:hypothetical protein
MLSRYLGCLWPHGILLSSDCYGVKKGAALQVAKNEVSFYSSVFFNATLGTLSLATTIQIKTKQNVKFLQV